MEMCCDIKARSEMLLREKDNRKTTLQDAGWPDEKQFIWTDEMEGREQNTEEIVLNWPYGRTTKEAVNTGNIINNFSKKFVIY